MATYSIPQVKGLVGIAGDPYASAPSISPSSGVLFSGPTLSDCGVGLTGGPPSTPSSGYLGTMASLQKQDEGSQKDSTVKKLEEMLKQLGG